MTQTTQNVNPSHYKGRYGYQCADMLLSMFGRDATFHFYILNAAKYLYRFEDKNGTEDLLKALWYVNAASKLPVEDDSAEETPVDYQTWKVKLSAFKTDREACAVIRSTIFERLSESCKKGRVDPSIKDMIDDMYAMWEHLPETENHQEPREPGYAATIPSYYWQEPVGDSAELRAVCDAFLASVLGPGVDKQDICRDLRYVLDMSADDPFPYLTHNNE